VVSNIYRPTYVQRRKVYSPSSPTSYLVYRVLSGLSQHLLLSSRGQTNSVNLSTVFGLFPANFCFLRPVSTNAQRNARVGTLLYKALRCVVCGNRRCMTIKRVLPRIRILDVKCDHSSDDFTMPDRTDDVASALSTAMRIAETKRIYSERRPQRHLATSVGITQQRANGATRQSSVSPTIRTSLVSRSDKNVSALASFRQMRLVILAAYLCPEFTRSYFIRLPRATSLFSFLSIKSTATMCPKNAPLFKDARVHSRAKME